MTIYDKPLRHARLNHIIFSMTFLYSICSFWFLVDKNKCILQIHVVAESNQNLLFNKFYADNINHGLIHSILRGYRMGNGYMRSKGFNKSENKRTQNYVFVDM